MSSTKFCSACQTEKPVADFTRQKQHRDGLSCRCRPCERAYHRTYKKAHPEELVSATRRYYLAHKAEILAKNRARVIADKERENAYKRAWREKNKEKTRAIGLAYRAKNKAGAPDAWLRKNYGISLAEKEATLAEQGGGCAICHTDAPGGAGKWHMDHDHVTGVPRGVLCHKCNIGIGMLGDSIERLHAAILYLSRPPLRLVAGGRNA